MIDEATLFETVERGFNRFLWAIDGVNEFVLPERVAGMCQEESVHPTEDGLHR
jgi:hypothetical protein